ncbi:hypodermin-A-like [Chrysoperla carnea]|uniref:hypodermin-A-like n=1 Tax=Chrysoperla carnea TaxID=189513 RepID=UPI001D07527E|nr:hypodermin-A-like [Chrysoperla carnea]
MFHVSPLLLVIISQIFVNGHHYGGIFGQSGNWIEESTCFDPSMLQAYVVSVNIGPKHVCGGSILKPNIILTAGSCLPSKNHKVYTVIYNPFGEEKSVRVKKITTHPKFKYYDSLGYTNYDAAILVLEEPLELFHSQLVIQLTEEDLVPGEKAIAINWMDRTLPLEIVDISVIDNDQCNQRNKQSGPNVAGYPFESQMCGITEKFCHLKDVGMPIIKQMESNNYFNPIVIGFGIYSRHYKGCDKGTPGLITRMSHIYEFVMSVIDLNPM